MFAARALAWTLGASWLGLVVAGCSDGASSFGDAGSDLDAGDVPDSSLPDAFVPADGGVPDAFVPDCATTACGANEHCVLVEGAPECVCDDGFEGDVSGHCVDVDECARGALTCDPRAVCRNAPGTATCACLPGTSGDGSVCHPATVLVLAPPILYGDNVPRGVMAAGFEVISTTSETAFATAFDAGGFELVIVAGVTVGETTATRLESWVDGGGRLIIATVNMEAPLRAVAGVEVTTFTTARPVVHDPTPPDLFVQQGLANEPMTPSATIWAGDVLVPTAAGAQVFAHWDSQLGPAAIVSTRDGRVIVNGFTPQQITADVDGDGLRDFGELIQNEVNYLLRPRVLVSAEMIGRATRLPAVIHNLGWTALDLSTSLSDIPYAYYNDVEFDAIAIDSAGVRLLDEPTQSVIAEWVAAGRPALIGYPDLDGSDRSTATLRSALQVSVVDIGGVARPITRESSSPVDLFEAAASPLLAPVGALDDNGDELTPTEPDGFVAARFEAGGGAIAVTRDTQVIVNGFAADAYEPDDVAALFMNELLFLLAR